MKNARKQEDFDSLILFPLPQAQGLEPAEGLVEVQERGEPFGKSMISRQVLAPLPMPRKGKRRSTNNEADSISIFPLGAAFGSRFDKLKAPSLPRAQGPEPAEGLVERPRKGASFSGTCPSTG